MAARALLALLLPRPCPGATHLHHIHHSDGVGISSELHRHVEDVTPLPSATKDVSLDALAAAEEADTTDQGGNSEDHKHTLHHIHHNQGVGLSSHLHHHTQAEHAHHGQEWIPGHRWSYGGYQNAGFLNDLTPKMVNDVGVSWTKKDRSIGIKGKQRMYLAKDIHAVDWALTEIIGFDLRGRTISFTVDLSNVPCGVAACLYFTENWEPQPGKSGYCDAQPEAGGCFELDIMEANQFAYESSVHTEATGRDFNGKCNQNGCSNNIGRYPFTTEGTPTKKLYGPKSPLIDTRFPFQVYANVTADGYLSTSLTQNGKWINVYNRYIAGNTPDVPVKDQLHPEKYPKPAGVPPEAAKATIKAMKDRGVRLVASMWTSQGMDWLDHGACQGKHGDVHGAVVIWSDLKIEPTPGAPQAFFSELPEARALGSRTGLSLGAVTVLLGAVTAAVALAAGFGRRVRRQAGARAQVALGRLLPEEPLAAGPLLPVEAAGAHGRCSHQASSRADAEEGPWE
mmetsp:Transcript_99580/g.277222  ORF Transcript_99580/g.277222 Transcript_99580/m.277222 type:complete len:510 (-) Transcript_99580:118-1647(-)